MANQPQARPWFRLASLARPTQPMAPPPAPAAAPRPQMRPAAALLPRPTTTQPTFRPTAGTQSQTGQNTTPPLQAPTPTLSSIAPASGPPRGPTPPVALSPVSPPKPLPKLGTTSPITQTSPATEKSPLASPMTRKSPPPESPVTHKNPLTPKSSRISSTISSPPSLPSSPHPKSQSPKLSVPTSPDMKQEVVARPVPASPAKLSLPSPPPKPSNENGLNNASNNHPVPSPRTNNPHPETPPPESPKVTSDGEHEKIIHAIVEQKKALHLHNTVGKPRPEQDHLGLYLKPNNDDPRLRFISISGDNRGAVMELGYSPTTHGNPHTHLSSPNTVRNDSASSVVKSSGNDRRPNNNAKAKPSTPMRAFMNSNVQGINSSIVFNTTLSHHDPGVHLSVTGKPVKGRLKEHSNGHNSFHNESGYRYSE
ncbi:hypothetical protein vseg_004538 [Gypsophila vaccaria]